MASMAALATESTFYAAPAGPPHSLPIPKFTWNLQLNLLGFWSLAAFKGVGPGDRD